MELTSKTVEPITDTHSFAVLAPSPSVCFNAEEKRIISGAARSFQVQDNHRELIAKLGLGQVSQYCSFSTAKLGADASNDNLIFNFSASAGSKEGHIMFDLLKKSVYSTIGLAYLTREKLEEMGRKMAKDADATEEEGRKFIDELLKKSDEAKGAMSRQIHDIVEKTLRNLDLATRAELRRLENRVAELERKIEPPTETGPLG